MTEFKWEEYYDYDDNTFWVATITIDGYQYSYRIRQKIISNKKVYSEDSDIPCRIDPEAFSPEHWSNLEDAKYDMWRQFLATFDEKDN